ncbi:MAG: hypothetical protein WAW61_04765, partial [Methylococcaceae bacterium]
MGFLTSIAVWVSTGLFTAVKVVKKAAVLVHKSASIVDALLEGKTILVEDTPSQQNKTSRERPDIMAEQASYSRLSDISELQESIEESKKKLIASGEANELEHRRIQLQIDVMELVVSSSTFERFSNNINLHAANLQIHLQTIQNMAGLLDNQNHHRVAIKAVMGTLNHLINVSGVGDKVKKIDGLDIDIRP